MKRLHVHGSVENLADTISFYAALFAVPPAVTKPDDAEWTLDDPRVNFAISMRAMTLGSIISAFRSRKRRRTEEGLWPAGPGRAGRARRGGDHLLLRGFGKIVDRRSGPASRGKPS